jgi:parallel beta-helix repeat protein
MRHLGLVYKHVAGVYCVTASDNRITHNTITDVPRYGIAMKTFAPGSSSHRNVVEFNDIRRSNLETNDTGAIETLGRDRENTGNVIRHNLILDSVGIGTTADGKIRSPYFTWGIYLDDYSSGTVVQGNIVARTDFGAICVHGGKDNRFENNVFVDGNTHQIRLQPRDEFMKGNRFLRNIVAYSRRDSDLIYTWLWSYRRDNFADWDYNLYWLCDGDLNTLDVRNTPEGSFADWRRAGFDEHSLVADPLFENAAEDDYRLRGDSPAWELGFKRIPIERIGAEGWTD